MEEKWIHEIWKKLTGMEIIKHTKTYKENLGYIIKSGKIKTEILESVKSE